MIKATLRSIIVMALIITAFGVSAKGKNDNVFIKSWYHNSLNGNIDTEEIKQDITHLKNGMKYSQDKELIEQLYEQLIISGKSFSHQIIFAEDLHTQGCLRFRDVSVSLVKFIEQKLKSAIDVHHSYYREAKILKENAINQVKLEVAGNSLLVLKSIFDANLEGARVSFLSDEIAKCTYLGASKKMITSDFELFIEQYRLLIPLLFGKRGVNKAFRLSNTLRTLNQNSILKNLAIDTTLLVGGIYIHELSYLRRLNSLRKIRGVIRTLRLIGRTSLLVSAGRRTRGVGPKVLDVREIDTNIRSIQDFIDVDTENLLTLAKIARSTDEKVYYNNAHMLKALKAYK